jgi:DNA (cytosine-5)-methyltransferase 1
VSYDVRTGRGMRILDLFCGGGGAAMGLHQAFPEAEIVGVDIAPQKHYPFTFIQSDWYGAIARLPGLWEHVDHYGCANCNGDGCELCRGERELFVWASPPCQRYSTMTKKWARSDHPDLVDSVRESLMELDCSFCIENVPGAPLHAPITLCGSMFGLKVRRHRIFEVNFSCLAPCCNHALQPEVVGVYGHAGGSSKRDGLTFSGTDSWREAMGIDWMTGNELAEAIPPAYSRYIGEQFKLASSPLQGSAEEKEKT